MPARLAGLCSGASGTSASIAPTTSSSISVGAAEPLPAVHHPVPDRRQPVEVEPDITIGQRDLVRRRVAVRPRRSVRPAPCRRCRVAVEEAVLHRRRAAVEHQDPAHAAPAAWIAVIATVLTMSVTVAPRDRSLTGRRRPCMHRADRDRAGRALHRLVRVVAGVEVREDRSTVAWPATALPGSLVRGHRRVDRRVVLDRALHRQVRPALADQRGGRGDLVHVGAARRRCRSSRTASPPAARCRTRPRCRRGRERDVGELRRRPGRG